MRRGAGSCCRRTAAGGPNSGGGIYNNGGVLYNAIAGVNVFNNTPDDIGP